MESSFSTYQLLTMMDDDDFAYLMSYSPETVQQMCISLSIELLKNEQEKLN